LRIPVRVPGVVAGTEDELPANLRDDDRKLQPFRGVDRAETYPVYIVRYHHLCGVALGRSPVSHLREQPGQCLGPATSPIANLLAKLLNVHDRLLLGFAGGERLRIAALCHHTREELSPRRYVVPSVRAGAPADVSATLGARVGESCPSR
jgi:hypothetical protein